MHKTVGDKEKNQLADGEPEGVVASATAPTSNVVEQAPMLPTSGVPG